MAIELTERAARHVEKMLAQRPQSVGLRLGTKKSGCTGFAYLVDYADTIEDDDRVFETMGLKVVVDSASLPLVDGMTIDFVKTNILNEGFDFINPNIKEMCGCGESFSV
ncbi:MAG: iron-sulfur cluster assembly accessory protein [Candidatus Thiodiazotropha sp. (ex Monitilora ramsayi)]|nr:iron-sulfur cluster assembly accessory protein [Candidatus Thiodiazotropha sp. (ex Monitilora ramsayi)]